MRILALDPGESTGWALFEGEKRIDSGVILDGLKGFTFWKMPKSDILVLEDFVVEPGFVGRPVASEVIGAAYYRTLAGVTVRQLRSEKATLPGGDEAGRFEWLRGLGFSGVSHELDAISHVLIYLRNRHNSAALKKYWNI